MTPKPPSGPEKRPTKHAFSRYEKRPGADKRSYNKYDRDGGEQSRGYDSFKKREREPWRSPERAVIKSDVPEKKIVVSAEKLRAGVRKSQDDISGFVKDIVSSLSVNKNVKSIEIDLGFDSNGNFVGVGNGADASIRIDLQVE
ncbi:MAG: hypothetical protein KBD53_07940 [Candidatus Omnitrophica bacterium]|nr:hypothetical protein [Candidatus Omnitrophota bacterium]